MVTLQHSTQLVTLPKKRVVRMNGHSLFDIAGYSLVEKFYESKNSLIFRVCRQSDQKTVVLKVLRDEHPSPERIAWFKREYELLTKLNLTGVIQAYDLTRIQHRWLMVLEDFGGDSLARLGIAGQLATTEFLHLAIQITEILGQIHQKRIIHKDINPANILLNPSTEQVKIIDFGISTVLSRETQSFRNPNILEGTLTYISPEQTGRMNRAIDYRTDFYSLGVSFYELLTGQCPFEDKDPLAMVHAHIAKQPISPHKLADIPPILSDIVLKLMAKNAEDRYQSAFGLQTDLHQCLTQIYQTKKISFPLAQSDICDRFQISQKLYGREEEVNTLLQAFARVQQGGNELMLVAGYSGMGKSTLVQEIHKPITAQRGYFIAGKFEQLKRNLPYAAFAQAFQTLIHQILTENQEEIASWRDKILQRLGVNAQIMIDLVPDLELVLGKQPDVPILDPIENQNRLHIVFQNFVRVFAQAEHPLVLFLDDLQWADSASLKFLELMLTLKDSDTSLFIIGAYRNNEVTESHPFMLAVQDFRKAQVPIHTMTLSPLDSRHAIQLIADTLQQTPKSIQELAYLVSRKTGNNPFFLTEFLKLLYNQSWLQFNHEQRQWQWDIQQIRTQELTDNVVVLMADKVKQLPPATQEVLTLAACIGNRFDLENLAIIYERTTLETAHNLWTGITADLVLPISGNYQLAESADNVQVSYRFAHDRIQQAAYSLLPASDKEATHLRIGRLLQSQYQLKAEGDLFAIVNHLNAGIALMTDPQERLDLAQLNLQVGQKAKEATAYEPAANYFATGKQLLPTNSWQEHYTLTLALHEEAVETAFLTGNLEEMNKGADIVLQQAHDVLDTINIYDVKMQAYVAQSELSKSVAIGLEILDKLGISLPHQPNDLHAVQGIVRLKSLLWSKDTDSLLNLPVLKDKKAAATLRILSRLGMAAYLANPNLLPLSTFHAIRLLVTYGNTPSASMTYAGYGIMLCGVLNDAQGGKEIGELALKISDKFAGNQPHTASTLVIFNLMIHHWHKHLKTGLRPLLDAYQIGLETGNVEYATSAIMLYCAYLLFLGYELPTVAENLAIYRQVIEQLQHDNVLNYQMLYQQFVLNLLGQNDNPLWLKGTAYDDEAMLPALLSGNDRGTICIYYLLKLMLGVWFGDNQQARTHADIGKEYLDGSLGQPAVPLFYFYDSLSRLAMSAKEQTQRNHLQVSLNQQKMKKWAKSAPMNFLHKWHLVEAERARTRGKSEKAAKHYAKAIVLAHDAEYLQEEALAHELAGKFYLEQQQFKVGQVYLKDAHYLYQQWGAKAKTQALEKQFPHFLSSLELKDLENSTTTVRSTVTGSESAHVLDLKSILKASQAISGEIVLDKLLDRLMAIVIENAGAQTASLLFEEQGQWQVVAQVGFSSIEQAKVPMTMVQYVARTRESVVLENAGNSNNFKQDPYIQQHKPQSVLCMPLINQAKISGILYLENTLTTGAFTPDRLEILNLLSSQAAGALENARLYSHQIALTEAYSRFVPPEILYFLDKKSIIDVKLGDQTQREMTILFADIRNFTTLSEQMTPKENFDFINSLLSSMGPLIRQHNGFIDKYMGDSIMALFPDSADDAVRAAIAMHKGLHRINQQLPIQTDKGIRIGVGIHTGSLMLGTIGEAERMEGTVISDTVNTAARIEGLTKQYGLTILISGETLAQLGDTGKYKYRFVDKVKVKGKQGTVTMYEIFDGDLPEQYKQKLLTKEVFEKGTTYYYAKKFEQTVTCMEEAITHMPNDAITQTYLQQAKRYSQEGVPDDWDGVTTMTHK